MAISLSTAASRVLANAAAVATAMASGTTAAEAQAIADLLLVLSKRNDLFIPAAHLGTPTTIGQLTPG
jgi:hypothetical protein